MPSRPPGPAESKYDLRDAAAHRLGRVLHRTAPKVGGERTRPPIDNQLTWRLAQQMASLAAKSDSRARLTRRWVLPAAMAAAAMGLAVVALWAALPAHRTETLLGKSPRGTRSSALMIHGFGTPKPGRINETYVATASRPMELRFSHGGRIVLATGAAVVVLRADATSRQLRLMRGSVNVTIPPGGDHKWTLVAGAHRVRVTGTVFSLRYIPGPAAHLDVLLSRGSVQVTGPGIPASGRSVSPGHPLRLHRSSGHWESGAVATQRPTPPSRVSPGQANDPSPDQGAPAPPSPSGAKSTRLSSWGRWYDVGKYVALVADARRKGIPHRLGSLRSRELWLLAQSARYARAPRLALAALAQLRRRFPTSHRAREASYLMGRIRHDQLHDPHRACALFGRYLKESPQGVLREEALGRRIASCGAAGRNSAAKESAIRYLKRHPRGIFRTLARRTLGLRAIP